ncbi:MAG: hypothetical protein ABIR91_05180 [Candidatus Saccharimonadales bacterium]
MKNNILKQALSLIVGDTNRAALQLRVPKKHLFRKFTDRELIQLESEIGARLFGPIPEGQRREFFCLDENTWIWYQEGLGTNGEMNRTTTRYEVHENGILKVQEGSRYDYIEGDELNNLLVATRMYHEQVARGIYKIDPKTGKKLAK